MAEQHAVEKEVALESIITTAVQIPGVKVNRRTNTVTVYTFGVDYPEPEKYGAR